MSRTVETYERHAAERRELARRARERGDEGMALWWEREAERWQGHAEGAMGDALRWEAGRASRVRRDHAVAARDDRRHGGGGKEGTR